MTFDKLENRQIGKWVHEQRVSNWKELFAVRGMKKEISFKMMLFHNDLSIKMSCINMSKPMKTGGRS